MKTPCILALLALLVFKQPVCGDDSSKGTFTNLGPQVTATTIQGSVFVRDESGRQLVYTIARGEPAHLLGYDVETGTKLIDLPMPGSDGAWTATVSSDNRIYTASSNGHLFRLKPGTASLEDLGKALATESIVWDVCAGENGEVFGATYPGCRVFRYSPKEGFSDVGQGPLVPNENYVRAVAYDAETQMVYAGIGAHAHLIRLNPKTGEKHELLAERVKGQEAVYSLGVIPDKRNGNHLLAWLVNRNKTLIYNLKTHTIEREVPTQAVKSAIGSPDGEGVYYDSAGELMSIELSRPEQAPKAIIPCATINASAWVDPNELCLLTSHAELLRYTPGTGKTRTISLQVPPQPIPIQSIELGPDGNIWMGGFLAGGTARFDPLTGKSELFKGLSQIERIGVLGQEMYFGVYPHGRLYEFAPDKSWSEHNPRQLGQVPGQSRPIALLGVPELAKVFIGTVPEYGKLGGHLLVYDPAKDKLQDEGEVVSKQSVVSLAYANALILGGTSVAGGLGIQPEAKHAQLFGWDPQKAQKVFELEPVANTQAITALINGPDHNIWGVANGTLFVFDPASRKVLFTKGFVEQEKRSYEVWRDAFVLLHPSGKIYATLDNRLLQIDPATKAVTVLRDKDADRLAMDRQGRLYFRDKVNLWRYTPPDSGKATSSGQK